MMTVTLAFFAGTVFALGATYFGAPINIQVALGLIGYALVLVADTLI